MRRGFRYIAPVLLSGLLLVGRGHTQKETRLLTLVHAPVPVPLAPYEGTILADSINVVTDPSRSLDAFYQRLGALRRVELADSLLVVPIFHLGDSHIQAGFLTGTVMRLFHRDFGNAGRGLIAPYRMARTNEPSDYSIRSEGTWESARLTQSARRLPIGIGGVAVETKQPRFSLTVKAFEKDSSENYTFNKIRVFKHPAAPELQFALDGPVSELTLSAQAGPRDSAIYYGFSLENGRSGVLYHATGVNGAQFGHWARTSGWVEQAAALHPVLIVLSLGSNEAMATSGFSASYFEARIDQTVRRLTESNPQAVFLFTTPPQVYRRRRTGGRYVYDPNPLTERVAEVIRDYAAANGHACWDLLTVCGGPGSAEAWQQNGLLRPDHIHFTPEGYRMLAEGFYRAIIKGYNRYVVDPDGEPAPAAEL